ncbi:type IV secretion system protein VirB8 [Luteibacter sp. 1214]|nr:type IV secretion system protein VirB8 [Luteibacter sp. 1214]
MVAFASIIMSLILLGGYFYMLPLKEKVPYIVMADANSGLSSVAQLTDDVFSRRVTASEAVNRSNIAHFILARESFDVAIINMRDWATVLTMSSPSVAQVYVNLHAQSNPDAPFKTYGRERAIRVKILSIVLIGGGNGATPKGATVRFQRSVFNKQTGVTVPLDSKIATMEFTYKPNLKMDDQYRVENPLGFQVTTYRVDNDYAEGPPPEVPATQDPSAAPTGAPSTAPETSGAPSAIPQGAQAAPLSAPPIPESAAPVAPQAVPQNAANGGRR